MTYGVLICAMQGDMMLKIVYSFLTEEAALAWVSETSRADGLPAGTTYSVLPLLAYAPGQAALCLTFPSAMASVLLTKHMLTVFRDTQALRQWLNQEGYVLDNREGHMGCEVWLKETKYGVVIAMIATQVQQLA